MFNATRTCMYDIDFINELAHTVCYSKQAVNEYEQGMGNGLAKYTQQFETDYAAQLAQCSSEDIGGLIVYTRNNAVAAVYDYENFGGWIV